jgi:hypothetical protein
MVYTYRQICSSPRPPTEMQKSIQLVREQFIPHSWQFIIHQSLRQSMLFIGHSQRIKRECQGVIRRESALFLQSSDISPLWFSCEVATEFCNTKCVNLRHTRRWLWVRPDMWRRAVRHYSVYVSVQLHIQAEDKAKGDAINNTKVGVLVRVRQHFVSEDRILTFLRIIDGLLRNYTALKNDPFWDVTTCGSCKNRRFRGT